MAEPAAVLPVACPDCERRFATGNDLWNHSRAKKHGEFSKAGKRRHRETARTRDYEPDTEPDWTTACSVCGQVPIVPVTGLCGPCTWGEAETIGGNW